MAAPDTRSSEPDVPVDRIDPPAWSRTAPALAVVAALSRGGARPRFVGGCVRDHLAERAVFDLDLATPEPPETVMARLDEAGIRAIPTGIEHGTVTAVEGGHPFEITTLRRDVETDGRRAVVAFTDDWREDAARRDFTINAMSLDPEGALYDYFGGREDLASGRVRFVGKAEQRIREDYLRILRFFRFQARFGRGEPDPEALAAVVELAPGIARLASERLHAELLRLLATPEPVAVVRLMVEHGIMARIAPELSDAHCLGRLVGQGLEESEPLTRLASLVAGEDRAAAALRVAHRLRFSGAERRRLVELAEAPALARDLDDPARLRAHTYRLGLETTLDALRLEAAARERSEPELRAFAGAIAQLEAWTPPPFPLGGRDVTALGIAPGPTVGELLSEIEDWWLEQGMAPGRAACLERLQTLTARRRAGEAT